MKFRLVIVVCLSLVLAATGGCSLPTGLLKSRWAMDDPAYSEKYLDGAEKDDLPGKIKQAMDARFQKGTSGMFVSGGIASRTEADNTLLGVAVGAEDYLTSYLTSRAALSLFANEEDLHVGVEGGVRLQSPTRLAPFVGVGAFAGYAKEVVSADRDGFDNDDNGITDERGETRERLSNVLLSVYPETGVHFWWTPKLRLTGLGRYHISTEGRAADHWLIGASVAVFER